MAIFANKNDTVAVAFNGTVNNNPADGDALIRVTDPTGQEHWVSVSYCTVTAKAIAVNDTVTVTTTGRTAVVLALAGDEAWVQDTITGARTTPKINKLVRQ